MVGSFAPTSFSFSISDSCTITRQILFCIVWEIPKAYTGRAVVDVMVAFRARVLKSRTELRR